MGLDRALFEMFSVLRISEGVFTKFAREFKIIELVLQDRVKSRNNFLVTLWALIVAFTCQASSANKLFTFFVTHDRILNYILATRANCKIHLTFDAVFTLKLGKSLYVLAVFFNLL